MSINKKDWTVNPAAKNAVLGVNNKGNTDDRSEHDYYATPSVAVDMLAEHWHGSGVVWEPAAGQGHMSKALQDYRFVDDKIMFRVVSTDLIVRDNCLVEVVQRDFLTSTTDKLLRTDIVTNPPYVHAEAFIRKGLELIEDGYYVCMLLPIRYLEGKARRKLFDEHPPFKIIVSSSRITCAKNGDFSTPEAKAGAVSYAWYIWKKGWKGETKLCWGN